MSYQNTLSKPENPTQGHMTSPHKDVRYATKTSSYATKTSVMPQRHQSATKRGCQDTNVTETTTFGWVITCHGPMVKT